MATISRTANEDHLKKECTFLITGFFKILEVPSSHPPVETAPAAKSSSEEKTESQDKNQHRSHGCKASQKASRKDDTLFDCHGNDDHGSNNMAKRNFTGQEFFVGESHGP